MCCDLGSHHGGSCGCGCLPHSGRGFWTRDEKVAWLEEYLEGLQREAKAVEERIAAMKEEK